MLGSHPEIEPVGELPYIPAILRSFLELATRRGKITVPQAIAAMTDDQAAAFGKDYLARSALHRKTDSPHFIDKLPQNWSNVLFIRKILPQARFIDIRRPAMDCCFSNFKQHFARGQSVSFRLEDIGRYYRDYVELMAHFDAVLPGRVHRVHYEAMVADTGREAPTEAIRFYSQAGWSEEALDVYRARFGGFSRYLHALPDSFRRISDNEQLRIGANTWRVIVGKTSTPTPVFAATVTGVNLNPWWNIPASIVREKRGRFPASQGYVYLGGQWRQKPGPNNALVTANAAANGWRATMAHMCPAPAGTASAPWRPPAWCWSRTRRASEIKKAAIGSLFSIFESRLVAV